MTLDFEYNSSDSFAYNIFMLFGAIIIFILAFIALLVLPTAIGALVGYVVSFFFNDTIMTVLSKITNINDLQLWQIGATIGFVGGFFKSHNFDKTIFKKKKDDD